MEWIISRTQEITSHRLPIPPDPDVNQELKPLAATFATLNDLPIVVGVGGHSSIRVWNALDGSLLDSISLVQAHGMALHTVEVARVAGRPTVLCGGYTSTLAMWLLDTREEHHLSIGSPVHYAIPLPGDRVAIAGPQGILTVQLSANLPARRIRSQHTATGIPGPA